MMGVPPVSAGGVKVTFQPIGRAVTDVILGALGTPLRSSALPGSLPPGMQQCCNQRKSSRIFHPNVNAYA